MIWEDRWGRWGVRGQWGYGSGHGSDRVLGERRVSGEEGKKMGDIPWNKKRPTIFEARPKEPTMMTSRGFEMSRGGREWDEWDGSGEGGGGRTGHADEALESLETDGEAEGEEEDAVDESSEDFGAVPAVRVARVGVRLFGELEQRE
jgi:hypothetical protein